MWSRTQGQGEIPALFLHCGLGMHSNLMPLARRLPEYTTTLVDLVGHGQSGPPDPRLTLAANAEAAAEVFDGPGVVLGHSFGAVAALRFALNHPERVTRLVLIEPVLFAAARGTQAFEDYGHTFAPISAAMQLQDWQAAARQFLGLWSGPDVWTGLPEKARTEAARRMPIIQATEADLVHDQTGILASGKLEQLTCPVQLIEGALAHPIIPAIHASLAQRMLCDIDVIGAAGHMAPLTHPDAVARAIREAA